MIPPPRHGTGYGQTTEANFLRSFLFSRGSALLGSSVVGRGSRRAQDHSILQVRSYKYSGTDFLTNPLPSSSLFSLMGMFPCRRPDPFRRTDGRTDGGNGFIQRRIFGGGRGRGRSLGRSGHSRFLWRATESDRISRNNHV